MERLVDDDNSSDAHQGMAALDQSLNNIKKHLSKCEGVFCRIDLLIGSRVSGNASVASGWDIAVAWHII
jgi:hypothetical protein